MDTVLLIVIGVLSRLAPHPPNMTAVGAVALFSGARLGATRALLVTTITMVITDIVLGLHSVMWATYGCLLLTVVLGKVIRQRRSLGVIISASVASSVLFYLVTNFAVWAVGSLYPKTFSGLMESYVMAIPFFRNSLIGDLLYTGVFFGAYEYSRSNRKKTAFARVKH